MSKEAVQIRDLHIRKMPAFPNGLPDIKGLAKNINIIAGPNASGKTSSSRAIQNLLFQEKNSRTELKAGLTIQEENWQLELDHGHQIVQKEGVDASLPNDLPSNQEKNRYSLSLHELVRVEGQDLAKQIYDQSMGFDFDNAKKELSYEYPNPPRTKNEFKEYETKSSAYDEAFQAQKELANEEKRLNDLYQHKKAAEEANSLKALYEAVKAYQEALNNQKYWRSEVDQYPGSLENTYNNDFEQIEELERTISSKEHEKQEAETTLRGTKEEIAKLNLPESGLDQTVLRELQSYRDSLQNNNNEIKNLNDKITDAETKENEALHNLEIEVDLSQWEGISPVDIGGLEEFLDRAHKTQSKKQYLEARIAYIDDQLDPRQQVNIDQLKNAINTLSQWLQEQEGESKAGFSLPWLIGMGGLAVLSTILAFINIWLGLAGIIAIIGVGLVAYFKSRPTTAADKGTIREDDFRKTGFEEPESWTSEKVSEKLNQLLNSLAEAHWQQQLQDRKANLAEDLKAAQESWNKIEEEKEQWVAKIQTFPGLPQEQLDSFSVLYHFLSKIKEWQDAHTDLISLKEQLKSKNEQFKETLDAINARLTPLGREKADDYATASARIDQLSEDVSNWKNFNQTIQDKQDQVKRLEADISDNRQNLNTIYDRLEVDTGEKEMVRQLVNQLTDYQNAKNELRVAERTLDEKQRAMEGHSHYPDHAPTIQELTWDQVNQYLSHYQEQADRRDDLQKEISDIKSQINQKKQGNDVEKALADKEDALGQLEASYEIDVRKLTGALLTDHLKAATREQNQPAVQQKANELLSRITKGRYELRLSDSGNDPSFLAYDTVLQKGQELNDLSSGTRIQLLLAVRLAFLETQETNYKLPILADEVLANSDDERARAIIDTLVAVSREGRQVFYFTAQSDELGKWQAYLQQYDDIDYTIKHLTGEDQFDPGGVTTQIDKDALSLLNQVPEPNGLTHQAYADKLNIPPFDSLTQDPTQLHLWYLFEEPHTLYHCLRRSISMWGQLSHFVKHDGDLNSLGINDYQKLEDKTKILERFQEEYKLGRSRPIDRQVLVDSGAVSNNFINEVTEKLKEVNFDPEALIQALNKGDVKRFNKSKAKELEGYLIDKGYIDDLERQSIETIKAKIIAEVSKTSLTQEEADNFIGSLLQRQEAANSQ